ncbi:MAG: hypothetical protein E7539_05780 [Ruminococcaceae bacterium]|nr:hypothetical protein [Oscillospiraceae bacterium]
MRNFFGNLGYKFASVMYGRNGVDSFNKFLVISSIVITFLSNLPFLDVLYIIGVALMAFALFRCFSKNLYKRRQENAKYLSIAQKFKYFFAIHKKMFKERKTHRYFKCECGTILRVPRGKGKIKIHCSKCGKDIIKTT